MSEWFCKYPECFCEPLNNCEMPEYEEILQTVIIEVEPSEIEDE